MEITHYTYKLILVNKYYLYQIYSSNELYNSEKAVQIKNFITSEYPNSIYANFLSNQEFEILSEKIKGPKTNAPEKAVEGFMRSNEIEKKDLDDHALSSPHQGIMAEVEPLTWLHLEDYVEKNTNSMCLILLDQLTNSQNIGSILRLSLIHI